MKLRKLILSGFKSFADRTELEFDDRVSAIVGPNGCGKSNIVDAIRWVLGEQSAKSLRGSEMMDVIFNGCATRKPAGHAEVSMVFDNSDGTIQSPVAAEGASEGLVAVTRRLFRDGTSEYLINKTVCRLKDIREMLMDTGVGQDAYSVIEQGKVAAFLNASQEERRAIFDEAAGISKYKARKKEALRKLERVEQNLLRVNDVFEEVQKRLRSIKYQAGKARSYEQYSTRLKELRSLHFLAQYHTLGKQRKDLQLKHDQLADELAAVAARIDQLEAADSAAQVELADLERAAREVEGRIAAIGAQITAAQQRSEMLAARVTELGEQLVATGARGEELEAKIEQTDDAIAAQQAQYEQLQRQADELSHGCNALRQEHTTAELAISDLVATLEDEKAGTIDLLRRTAQLHNEVQTSRVRRESLSGQKTRLASRADEVVRELTETLSLRASVEARLADIQELLDASQKRLDETRNAGRQAGDAENALRHELAEARERRSALVSRLDALTEMQARLEGVGAGAKGVLQAVRNGRLGCVMGMLGDFIDTDLASAPLVEAALAGADEQLVVERFVDASAAAAEVRQIVGEGGSVELLCLDGLEPLCLDFDPSGDPDVQGRVIDLVRCASPVAGALWRMLGRSLVVADLSAAYRASRRCPRGYRFVTLQGQVLEADGRIRIGAAGRSAGIVARRSELADLERRLAEMEQAIGELEGRCRSKQSEREHLEELGQSLRTAIYETSTERVEAQSRLAQLSDQVEKLQREQPLLTGDIGRLTAEIEQSVQAEHQANQKAQDLERIGKERQQHIEELTARIEEARRQQDDRQRRLTESKVALAQAQEQARSLAQSSAALRRQREQMEQDLISARALMEADRRRRQEAQASIESLRGEVERLYSQQETLNTQAQEVEESRKGLAQRLEQTRKQLIEQRRAHEDASARAGTSRVEIGEVDVRIESVIARSGEDGMNLLEACKSYQHDDARDWSAVEAEIQDLRGKIERLGNVNLDAIAEQDELEKREQFLSTQLSDIRSSQEQLQDLIRRINKESRDRFAVMFETIRANFQELFRKLFGGGRADIVLGEGDDVLESPIEIIARPPGKEVRSLMLLSGGESTMTTLSLLFAIFRSRPTPFCLLDEVDAALDEQNNRRFCALVREFVEGNQFIIITHQKPTMSSAQVLYGVTMQEPGVSTRIAVRFEEAARMAQRPAAAVQASA
jgi:chromosome segregation protein